MTRNGLTEVMQFENIKSLYFIKNFKNITTNLLNANFLKERQTIVSDNTKATELSTENIISSF